MLRFSIVIDYSTIVPSPSAPLPEVRDSSDQETHYHIVGPYVSGFISDPALGC
jgi:hypothetical protein